MLALLRLRFDGLYGRLVDALSRAQRERVRAVGDLALRLPRAFTVNDIRARRDPVEVLYARLRIAATRSFDDATQYAQALDARLEGVSPQAALARGYSIVYSRKKNVRRVSDVQAGDQIDVRVLDGIIRGVVQEDDSGGVV